MRRSFYLALAVSAAAAGGCSFLNAPEDVKASGTGGGGTATTTSSGAGGAECATPADCSPPADACHTVSCEEQRCVTANADGKACDDGAKCTQDDVCTDGVCAGAAVACDQPIDRCMASTCNESTGLCVVAPGNDGNPCDDGDPCTKDGTCAAGACTPGPDACAELSTDCSDAVCMIGGCVAQPKLDGTGCGMSFCSNGQCEAGHCNIVPINEGVACDDQLFCMIGETCQGGFCLGVPNPCPTGNVCAKPGCDEAAQTCTATPIPDNNLCDDGDACTAGEFCSNQQCIGGLTPSTHFSESFANDTSAWTLGPEWQIGAAVASSGGQFGADPGFDYDGDGVVAGVELGGNALVTLPDPTHPPYYLTSPVINTKFAGQVYLTFYRWLNSDYQPYMHNTVEASSDGVNWTVVWETTIYPTTDAQWTFQSVDITAFKSTTTQVRWGFSIDSAGVYTVGSWNIDHVKIQNAPCPL